MTKLDDYLTPFQSESLFEDLEHVLSTHQIDKIYNIDSANLSLHLLHHLDAIDLLNKELIK